MRDVRNRVRNWTGTVHYADRHGRPACGPIATADSYMEASVATVTCERCIARFGADEAGHVDPEVTYYPDEHAARRAAERAARRAGRS